MHLSKKIFLILILLLPVILVLTRFHDIMNDADGNDYLVVVASGNENDYVLQNDKYTKVILTGKSPAYELSYIFERNRFKVYGLKDEILSKEYECMVWNVTDWEILAPIRRDYDPLDWEARGEQRYFASVFSFDEYDKKWEDYRPILNDKLRMGYKEKKFWLKQDGYYLIYPERIEETVKWKLIQNDNSLYINISGDNPEDRFSRAIINNRVDEKTGAHSENYFVVKGKLEGTNLDICQYWLCMPIKRFERTKRSSPYGFTLEDVVEGVVSYYKPQNEKNCTDCGCK